MSDEHVDEIVETPEGDLEPETGLEPETDLEPGAEDPKAPPSRGRRAAFAVVRGVIVLVAAGVVYQFVIPFTQAVPNRISSLVITKTGVAAYDATKSQAGIQDATQTGLAAMNAALKKSPRQTGLYSIEWSPSQTSAAGVIVFVVPDSSDAAALFGQIQSQQLAASAFTSEGLTRHSTGPVPGIPGSAEAVYTPASKTAGPSTLTVTLFRRGRVVSVVEVLASTNSQADAHSVATKEYSHLAQVVPGFSLTRVVRPTLATSLWAAGAVAVALIAALGPVAWRRRAATRRRRLEEALAHQVRVGDQVIYKYRR